MDDWVLMIVYFCSLFAASNFKLLLESTMVSSFFLRFKACWRFIIVGVVDASRTLSMCKCF